MAFQNGPNSTAIISDGWVNIHHNPVEWSDRDLGFAHETAVDGGGGPAALTHGQNDRGTAGDDVATSEDARERGLARFVVNHNNATLEGLEALVGLGDEGVHIEPERHHQGVAGDHDAFVGHLGAAAAVGAGLAQLHHGALGVGHPTLVVAMQLHGRGEVLELHTLLHGVFEFLFAGRGFLHGAAVDHRDMLRAHAAGGTGGVHGRVARAHDDDVLADGHRRGVVREEVGAHEVDASEELVGGVDALVLLARNAHHLRQAGTGAHEDGIVLLAQVVQGHAAADEGVHDELHAQAAKRLHLLIHDLVGQAEFGDAVEHHAAGLVEGVVDRDPVTLLDELTGHGEARGARADDGHLLARGDFDGGQLVRAQHAVAGETLQAADGDGQALDAHHALDLALLLLGADATAHRAQRGAFLDDPGRGLGILVDDLLQEGRDVDAHRASFDAG